MDPRQLLSALKAYRDGDFSTRLPEGQPGTAGEIAVTFNDLAQRSEQLCAELGRLGREIGIEGRFGGQAEIEGAEGQWKDLLETFNLMAANLTDQVRCLTHVITSVSMGAFARQPFPEARRETAGLFATVNALIDNLAALAEQLPASPSGVPIPLENWSAPDQPVRRVAAEHSMAWALNRLAEAARERGDFTAARSFLVASLALARELERKGNRWWIAPAIEGFAGLSAAEREPERAARLFAAAAALRSALGRPTSAETLDQNMAPLRIVLGEATLAAIWSKARALTKDEAIALALGEL
jgi:hypothetical protein